MRAITFIIYTLIGIALAWFAARNWIPVTLQLWPPYEMVIRLPVLVIAAVFLGALPVALLHVVSRWRWRRRLAKAERQLAKAQPLAPAEASPISPGTPQPGAAAGPLPQAQPIVVPPAGA